MILSYQNINRAGSYHKANHGGSYNIKKDVFVDLSVVCLGFYLFVGSVYILKN